MRASMSCGAAEERRAGRRSAVAKGALMFRSTGRSVIAAILALVLSNAAGPAAAADPYAINAILPVTGSGAFLGTEEQAALATVEARVNQDGGINGRQIHFVVADDQSNPRTAVQLAAALVAQHVPIILGSSLSALCSAIVPLVTAGPVLYCFSPGIRPQPGSFVFSASFSTGDLIAVSLRYLRLRGLDRIALITSTDTTGQEAERSIDAELAKKENADLKIVAREHFNPTDISAAAQMTRIKASGAQVTIAWSTGTPVATLLRSANDAGIETPILTSNGNLTYNQMRQYASFLPKELLFPAGPSYASDEIGDAPTRAAVAFFLAEFNQQGVRPDNGQNLAWDPALLLVSALRALGTNVTSAQLRTYFSSRKNWTGANGSYDFTRVPQRGLGQSGVVIVKWDAPNDTWAGVSHPGGRPL
jgi:branched-chain amino acid transport system substrate-binding protein